MADVQREVEVEESMPFTTLANQTNHPPPVNYTEDAIVIASGFLYSFTVIAVML